MSEPDWKKKLNGGGGGRRGVNPNLIDVSPLDEPVNAFGFAAALIRSQRKAFASRFKETEEEGRATDLRLAWLDSLAEAVPFMTTHPVEALTISRLACHKEARDMFLAAVDGVIEVGEAMNAQKKQSGS